MFFIVLLKIDNKKHIHKQAISSYINDELINVNEQNILTSSSSNRIISIRII